MLVIRRYIIILFITGAISVSYTLSCLHPFICTAVDKVVAIRRLSCVLNHRNVFSVLKRCSITNQTNLRHCEVFRLLPTGFALQLEDLLLNGVISNIFYLQWTVECLNLSAMVRYGHSFFMLESFPLPFGHYFAATCPNLLATTVTTYSFVFTFSLRPDIWYNEEIRIG